MATVIRSSNNITSRTKEYYLHKNNNYIVCLLFLLLFVLFQELSSFLWGSAAFFTGAVVDARPLIMQPSFCDYRDDVHEALKKPGVPHRLDYDGCGLLRRGGTWWKARKETSEKKRQ